MPTWLRRSILAVVLFLVVAQIYRPATKDPQIDNEQQIGATLAGGGLYASDKKSKLLEAICKEVTEGDMPPITYTPMHSSAKLTKADAQEICRWTAATRQTIAGGDGVKP